MLIPVVLKDGHEELVSKALILPLKNVPRMCPQVAASF
jgi:hypothetical protein